MSNQFSYELDERQIRILMQNAELEYDESAWQKFSAIPVVDHKQSISAVIPKINIGISRSVIVPIFFILMIGGLSTLLFSFVDFKKKEEVVNEIPLTKPTITKKIIPPAPVVTKPVVIAPVFKDTVVASSIVTTTVKEQPVVAKKTEQIAKTIEPIIKSIKTEPIASVRKEQKEITQVVPKKKKKRNRKEITEELPIINARTTSVSEGSSEPELEIK
jgi:hypothetical protein